MLQPLTTPHLNSYIFNQLGPINFLQIKLSISLILYYRVPSLFSQGATSSLIDLLVLFRKVC
jgi:hypothetical protein